MIVQLARWGNSLAVRIPASFAKELGAKEGLSADISVKDGCLIIRPTKQEKVYRLEDLLAGITSSNIHPETSTGYAYGAECIDDESILPEPRGHHLS